MKLILAVWLMSTLIGLPRAYAQETERSSQKPSGTTKTPLRGEYLVSQIKRLDQGGFEVVFSATTPTSLFSELRLTTSDIHIGLKSNQILRLAAEYLGSPQKNVEISQVLLYLPGDGTNQVPVWLMSSRTPQSGLTASKYLEMHAPSMDFQVY